MLGMADFADAAQKLINSPPGQLAAGGVLAGSVWKFFERVESVLEETTKFEIAVWLVSVQIGQTVKPWSETFANIFDRVFGPRHRSLACFWRSCAASVVSFFISAILASMVVGHWAFIAAGVLLPASVFPDYISLLKTRRLIAAFSRTRSFWKHACILVLDLIVGVLLALLFPAILALGTYLLLSATNPGESLDGLERNLLFL
jgi:hypothetical protein